MTLSLEKFIHLPPYILDMHLLAEKKKFPFSLSDQTEACDEVITSK